MKCFGATDIIFSFLPFRFYLFASALVAATMASEDVFLKWTEEQGKRYHTRAELTKRRAIFMKNYNRMVAHNQV